ncbi:MAG: ATP-grasp domain-containing protein [Methanosarcinales archaeon]|nr:ATP-grasp domain-containing protein [Methanosarcinales archaeon]
MNILVIGFNTRHIVCSARRAGYTVYSISNFADQDLEGCSEKSITHDIKDVQNIDLNELIPSIKAFLPVDLLVLGPGFEHLGQWAYEIIGSNTPILNNQQDIVIKVSDKIWLSNTLKAKNIPHPVTFSLDSLSTPDDWTKGFPAMLKPRYGAGGIDNILIENPDDLRTALEQIGNNKDQFLIQEFIRGAVVSVSVISTGKKAVAIAVNEQLSGIPELTQMPFAYCGNITPYFSKHNKKLYDIAVNLAIDLKLVGTNGIDFIITDNGPMVLEVNPRFQGSIDTIEKATGINIFKAHSDAFEGKLPVFSDYQCHCVKAIFFAPDKFYMTQKTNTYLLECLDQDTVADVPAEGVMFEKDDPVVSFIVTGTDRIEAIKKVKYLVNGLLEKLNNTKD